MRRHNANALGAGGSQVTLRRLELHGASALGDEQLLAILVGTNAVEATVVLLVACGTAQQLAHEPAGDLMRIKGMPPTRAAMVAAGVELCPRTLTRPLPDRERLSAPRDVAAFLRPRYGASPVERFGIVSLSTTRRVLRIEIVSTATLDASHLHPREVFRMPVTRRTAAIVIFHHHPSGDPTPSVDDIALTQRLLQAGSLMGIEVLDHRILAETRHCSFKETRRL